MNEFEQILQSDLVMLMLRLRLVRLIEDEGRQSEALAGRRKEATDA